MVRPYEKSKRALHLEAEMASFGPGSIIIDDKSCQRSIVAYSNEVLVLSLDIGNKHLNMAKLFGKKVMNALTNSVRFQTSCRNGREEVSNGVCMCVLRLNAIGF